MNNIKPNDKIILIYRLDLIGDYVISRDFLRLVRKCKYFEDYKIIFAGNKVLKDFIDEFDNQYIDEFIPINCSFLSLLFLKKFFKNKINKYKYSYILNYMTIRNQNSEDFIKGIKTGLKYCIKGLDLGLGKKQKEKFDKIYDKLFDVSSSYDNGALEFIRAITGEYIDEYRHQFNLKEDKLKSFSKVFNKPFVVIFPGASSYRKRLPFKYFKKYAEYIYIKYGLVSYICGSKNDKKIFKKENIDVPYLIDICGEYKLSDLPYIFRLAKTILTNDTCAMWIGKSVNKDILVFSNVQIDSKNLKVIKNKDNIIHYKNNKNFTWIYPKSVYQLLDYNKPVNAFEHSLKDIDHDSVFYSIDKILDI